MSRKSRKQEQLLERQNIEKMQKALDEFDSFDKQVEKLAIEKGLMLREYMNSNEPNKIMKAQLYLKGKEATTESKPKAYLFSPEKEFRNGLDYKNTLKSVSYDIQRGMAQTPVVRSVINTRVEQISNFSEFTSDLQKEGWTIVKNVGRFGVSKDYKRTSKDEKIIDEIATFLENGGKGTKWSQSDDFDVFLKKFITDSLELDQACFEIDRDRLGNPFAFYSVDGGTIRLLETVDDDVLKEETQDYELKDGAYPIYAQVWNQRIVEKMIDGVSEKVVWYADEMCFGVRNKTTNIRMNGYGKSELEVLIDIITWILYGFQYNGNFFKQGSNPKGFFTVDGSADPATLNDFKLAWRQTVMGIANSHKVPVFEGEKIKWVDMQHSNKDMEFQKWNEFLILITCAVYRIDPSELGFHFSTQAQTFGQDGQEQRLAHSKDKGLKPLLKFVQKQVNKFLVSELNDQYLFKFTGVDLEDEAAQVELDNKKLAGGMVSFESMFEKYEGEKYDEKKHTILNQVFQQASQMKQYGGEGMNGEVDEMDGGDPEMGTENPFEKYKSLQDNPIMTEAMKYVETAFKVK